MTRITVNLPDEVFAALGGDPEDIARRMEQWATEKSRPPTNGSMQEEMSPMPKEDFAALCESIAENYDFDAWKELRKRSLL